jgi:hypothetical protein
MCQKFKGSSEDQHSCLGELILKHKKLPIYRRGICRIYSFAFCDLRQIEKVELFIKEARDLKVFLMNSG